MTDPYLYEGARLDVIGWFIATMHDLLGHDKAAIALGVPAGDRTECIICRYDAGTATREQVITALGPPGRRPQ